MPRNKTLKYAAALLLVFATAIDAVGQLTDGTTEAIPKLKAKSFYASQWKNSAFMREVIPISKDSQKSFARDYAILGMIKYGNNAIVTLINKQTKKTVRVTERDENGFQLIEVEEGGSPRELFVTVSHQGKLGRIGYDDQILNEPAPVIAGSSISSDKQIKKQEAGDQKAASAQNSSSTNSPTTQGVNPQPQNGSSAPIRIILPGTSIPPSKPTGKKSSKSTTGKEPKRQVILPGQSK